MRRLTALFCLLLCLVLTASLADELPVLKLVEHTENGDVYRGLCLLINDSQVMMTTVGAMMQGNDLRATNGEQEFAIADYYVDLESGMTWLVMDGDTGMESIGRLDYGMPDQVVALLADGTLSVTNPQQLQVTELNGLSGYALTMPENALPYALLLSNGQVCGMVMGRQAEGVNRAVAYDAAAVRAIIDRVQNEEKSEPEPEVNEADNGIIQVEAVYEDGYLCVTVPEEYRGLELKLTVQDTLNEYSMTYRLDADAWLHRLPVVPGRDYCFAVWRADSNPRFGMQNLQSISVPEAELFDHFHFMNVSFGLSLAQANGGAPGERVQWVYDITAQTLADTSLDLCVQGISRYDMDEVNAVGKGDEVRAMMEVAFFTPEGYCFDDSGLFVFDSGEEDVWQISISRLLRSYEGYVGGYAPGEYRISVYLDGLLVDSMRFELE